jgi:hypothetical protein
MDSVSAVIMLAGIFYGALWRLDDIDSSQSRRVFGGHRLDGYQMGRAGRAWISALGLSFAAITSCLSMVLNAGWLGRSLDRGYSCGFGGLDVSLAGGDSFLKESHADGRLALGVVDHPVMVFTIHLRITRCWTGSIFVAAMRLQDRQS